MKNDPTADPKGRELSVSLISLALFGLLLFLLAALAPIYADQSSDFRLTAVLMGFGALLLGLSAIVALIFALIRFRRRKH